MSRRSSRGWGGFLSSARSPGLSRSSRCLSRSGARCTSGSRTTASTPTSPAGGPRRSPSSRTSSAGTSRREPQEGAHRRRVGENGRGQVRSVHGVPRAVQGGQARCGSGRGRVRLSPHQVREPAAGPCSGLRALPLAPPWDPAAARARPAGEGGPRAVGALPARRGQAVQADLRQRRRADRTADTNHWRRVMGRVRRGRKDGNHNTIKAAFESMGCSTADLYNAGLPGFPDFVLGVSGANVLVEVKNPENSYVRAGINYTQTALEREWMGCKDYYVLTPDDAVGLVNRRRSARWSRKIPTR